MKKYSGADESEVKADDETMEQPEREAPAAEDKTFKQAFREARNEGQSTFTWRGKEYTTELAKPKKEAAKKASPDYSSVTKKMAEQEDLEKYGKSKRLKALAETFTGGRETTKPVETRETMSSKMRDTGKSGRLKALVGSFKSGGSVSSASKRADGCAQRGKTRGKIV